MFVLTSFPFKSIKTSLKKEDYQLGAQILDDFESYVLKWNELKKTNRLERFNEVESIRSKESDESCFLLKLTKELKKFIENDFFHI